MKTGNGLRGGSVAVFKKARVAPRCPRCEHMNRSCNVCIRSYSRDRYAKRLAPLRAAVFMAYGNKCECCGESEPRFLTLEHKLGDGKAHRKAGGNTIRVYRDVIAQGFPDKYTVLCMNCNWASAHGKVCPHREAYGRVLQWQK